MLPAIVDTLGVDSLPWVGSLLAVTGAVTRVLAMPRVENILHRYAPWLATSPAADSISADFRD